MALFIIKKATVLEKKKKSEKSHKPIKYAIGFNINVTVSKSLLRLVLIDGIKKHACYRETRLFCTEFFFAPRQKKNQKEFFSLYTDLWGSLCCL